MNESVQLRLAGTVVGVGLGLMSDDLRWAWNHSPYDQGGEWILLGWTAVLLAIAGCKEVPRLSGLIAAVALGLVSLVGDLNVARHLALVIWGASFVPNVKLAWTIAVSGLAWWPAMGWVMAHFMANEFACLLRVAWLALFGGLGMWWARSLPQPKVKL